jgi:hypothetical protein
LCFYSSSVQVDSESFRDAPKPIRTQSPKPLGVRLNSTERGLGSEVIVCYREKGFTDIFGVI